jgi:hypothetical protein
MQKRIQAVRDAMQERGLKIGEFEIVEYFNRYSDRYSTSQVTLPISYLEQLLEVKR